MDEPLNTPNQEFNLGLFFDLSADLLCIAGYDGYFRKINPAVSKLLGFTEEELFSKSINSFVHPEDQLNTAAGRSNLTKNIPLLNFENRYLTKAGEVVWLSWTSVPIDSEQMVYAIAKNITHKKKLEEDRNALIKNLTHVNNELKQLNYTTSHDLRAPVSNLLSVFDMVDQANTQNGDTQQFIEMLRFATTNLKTTLDNYVDALTENNNLNTAVEPLSFTEVLNVVLRSLKSLVDGARATITVDFSAVDQVQFNRTYLESIFLNLVTNAIKYTRPGLAPKISIQSGKTDDGVQLTFSDKGIGFDMEKVKGRIFGFHQKFHDNTDSKGIGLYLIYNQINSLGGSISVESKINEGTTFSILFKG